MVKPQKRQTPLPDFLTGAHPGSGVHLILSESVLAVVEGSGWNVVEIYLSATA
jgi:hypothetical protein